MSAALLPEGAHLHCQDPPDSQNKAVAVSGLEEATLHTIFHQLREGPDCGGGHGCSLCEALDNGASEGLERERRGYGQLRARHRPVDALKLLGPRIFHLRMGSGKCLYLSTHGPISYDAQF